MVDNITAPGEGTILAADDVSGVIYPRAKVCFGADGSATDVSTASPLPISDASGSLTVDAPVATPVFVRLSDGSSAITTLPVSAASLPLPSGAAAESTLAAASAKLPATLGQKTSANSLAVTVASDQSPISVIDPRMEYEAVAASATDQVLGATGATGDYLSHIIIQPATTGAGTVTVQDGTTVIYTFTGGGTLADLSTRIIPFGIKSVSGAWKITTGTNVAVLGCGDFT